ncbi:MAG TPA: hypothetical protein VL053_18450 [Arachidicoccus sp.]|nr:hypothetical protein [Arachidicoccus sp.]
MIFTMSCSRTRNLSQSDYEWIPYRGNDTLIFASNTGGIDTIFILKKDTIWDYPDAQSSVGLQCEVVRVFCQHTDSVIQDKSVRYLGNDFYSIRKAKNGHTILEVNLLTKDVVFYRLGLINLDSLNKVKPITLKTKEKQYNDVYVINAEDYLDSFRKRHSFVTKIYWSKSRGLVRYDKENGNYWEIE